MLDILIDTYPVSYPRVCCEALLMGAQVVSWVDYKNTSTSIYPISHILERLEQVKNVCFSQELFVKRVCYHVEKKASNCNYIKFNRKDIQQLFIRFLKSNSTQLTNQIEKALLSIPFCNVQK